MALFTRKKGNTNERTLPVHIGIIMDGNGRWAKKRGLPRQAGHSVGAKTFRKITRYCNEIGIRYLTVYAFSTENWNRPADEVAAIMKLLEDYLQEALSDFKDENIKTQFIGDMSALNPRLQELIREVEASTAQKTGLTLNIALNYGGRPEIVTAARTLVHRAIQGEIKEEDITESMLSSCMYTAGQPDPDLIIRPSGEYRTSNFMLWQSAYSEYWFADILWPDFSTRDLDQAIDAYSQRNRRYGGV